MNKYLMANAALAKFSRNYMRLKRDLPIRPSEMGVLNIIVETEGPYTPMKLAEMLGVSKPMITAHLSALAKLGYITREQSEDDKRMFFVIPTKKAHVLVSEAREVMNRQLDLLVQQMGADEFDALVSLAEAANKVLEETESWI